METTQRLELFGVDAETDETVATAYEWALMDVIRRARAPLHEDVIADRIEEICQFMLEPVKCGWIDLAMGACVHHLIAQLYLEGLRWENEEAHCPKCQSTKIVRVMNDWFEKLPDAYARGRIAWSWRCKRCQRQFSFRHGTALHHSGTPYRNWCRALWCIAASPNGFTREEFRHTVGMSRTRANDMLERLSGARLDDPMLGHFLARYKRLDGRTREAEAGLHLLIA